MQWTRIRRGAGTYLEGARRGGLSAFRFAAAPLWPPSVSRRLERFRRAEQSRGLDEALRSGGALPHVADPAVQRPQPADDPDRDRHLHSDRGRSHRDDPDQFRTHAVRRAAGATPGKLEIPICLELEFSRDSAKPTRARDRARIEIRTRLLSLPRDGTRNRVSGRSRCRHASRRIELSVETGTVSRQSCTHALPWQRLPIRECRGLDADRPERSEVSLTTAASRHRMPPTPRDRSTPNQHPRRWSARPSLLGHGSRLVRIVPLNSALADPDVLQSSTQNQGCRLVTRRFGHNRRAIQARAFQQPFEPRHALLQGT